MSKIAVVFWTGTGNTSTMATAVVEGIKEAGAEAELIAAADFGAAKVKEYDGIAFGCPAMGDEVLEESEFAPMFDECKPELPGKKAVQHPPVSDLFSGSRSCLPSVSLLQV